MKITPLAPGFACKIEGLGAAAPSADDIAAMKSAMADYAVVVLPQQRLSEEAQVAFAERFGPLDTNTHASHQYNQGLRTDLLSVSNAGDGEAPATASDRRRLLDIGNKFWHSDSSFKRVTGHLSMLYALKAPAEGGETQFADLRAGYDGLSDEWKQLVGPLVAEHSVFHSREMLGFADWRPEQKAAPDTHAAHDLVRTLPESGRKSLYLSAHACEIIGLSLPVGRMLLHELTELATTQNNVYTHRWSDHDLVIWDNRCTMHRLRRYRAGSDLRVLRRVTTVDPTFPAREREAVRIPAWIVEAAA